MTKTLTTRTIQACVLDQQGRPLMPTTRLGLSALKNTKGPYRII